MLLVPTDFLRVLDLVLLDTCKLPLRNGAVDIIMRAVHETVEHKLNFS